MALDVALAAALAARVRVIMMIGTIEDDYDDDGYGPRGGSPRGRKRGGGQRGRKPAWCTKLLPRPDEAAASARRFALGGLVYGRSAPMGGLQRAWWYLRVVENKIKLRLLDWGADYDEWLDTDQLNKELSRTNEPKNRHWGGRRRIITMRIRAIRVTATTIRVATRRRHSRCRCCRRRCRRRRRWAAVAAAWRYGSGGLAPRAQSSPSGGDGVEGMPSWALLQHAARLRESLGQQRAPDDEEKGAGTSRDAYARATSRGRQAMMCRLRRRRRRSITLLREGACGGGRDALRRWELLLRGRPGPSSRSPTARPKLCGVRVDLDGYSPGYGLVDDAGWPPRGADDDGAAHG